MTFSQRIDPGADLTVYVAPTTVPTTGSWGDGVQVTIPAASDVTGDGTKAAPWATLQHAFDVLYSDYDFRNKYKPTIQLAVGAPNQAFIYGGASISGRLIGQAGTLGLMTANPLLPGWPVGKYLPFTLQGDITGPVSVASGRAIIQPVAGPGLSLTDGAALKISGFVIDTSSSGIDCIDVFRSFLDFSNIFFGYGGLPAGSGASHLAIGFQSTVIVSGNYEIGGPAWAHMATAEGSSVIYDHAGSGGSAVVGVTVSNAPCWQGAFFVFDSSSSIYAMNGFVSFQGPSTGKKFAGLRNASLETAGHFTDPFLPGNVAGTLETGAVAN
jgi:hypothetical protein